MSLDSSFPTAQSMNNNRGLRHFEGWNSNQFHISKQVYEKVTRVFEEIRRQKNITRRIGGNKR